MVLSNDFILGSIVYLTSSIFYRRAATFVFSSVSSGDHILFFIYSSRWKETGRGGRDTIVGCRRSPYGTIRMESAENKKPFMGYVYISTIMTAAVVLSICTMTTFSGRGGSFLLLAEGFTR